MKASKFISFNKKIPLIDIEEKLCCELLIEKTQKWMGGLELKWVNSILDIIEVISLMLGGLQLKNKTNCVY